MADELKTCANCGHTQATGVFCEACGTKLPAPPVAAAVPVSEQQAGAAATAPPPPPPPIAQPQYVAQSQYGTPPPPPLQAVQPTYTSQEYAPVPPVQAPGYVAYQPPNALADFAAFRKLITPALAQIAFWLFEGINLFYWIRHIYYGRSSALEIIFGLFALFITALLIRILMESVITIFKNKA